MQPISYSRHRFPPEVIRQPFGLYLRFTLSYRALAELLAERELDISYETVRRPKLRPLCRLAAQKQKVRSRPEAAWRLSAPPRRSLFA
ncbi:MAG: family transposase [Burkholderiales bacterium]|nr:family transposase [Burkholderiales bacterium]